MLRLTEKRKRILAFIVEYQQQQGQTPTVRQIAAAFDQSPSTIHFHISKLVRMGLLRRNLRGRLEVVDHA